ncbi:MAG: phenylacetate--CoA ligase family protein [Leptospiraceae bacterium]|nr:phenylacetate--CoA ligase family protein [Leptospiraceae bacterium]
MIPEELKKRVPLIEEKHLSTLQRIEEHTNAPLWNYQCGDRIQLEDLPFLKNFELELKTKRFLNNFPPKEMIQYVEEIRKTSWFYETKLKYFNIEKQFFSLPVTTRKDFAESLSLIIPHNVALDRLVINPTSGTTGHSIICPNHPRSIACYNYLILYALERNGVSLSLTPETVLAMQIYSQKQTAVYCTVKPILNGVGFCKLNLNPNSWKTEEDIQEFIFDLKPEFFSGNPIGFADYLEKKISHKPKAFLSTSMALSFSLRKELETLGAKVVDFYSLNDTGPIAYSCPIEEEAFHILPHDIFVEITDEEGNPKKEGEIGFITVTGGRNPYLPLVRYQTGDLGKMSFTPCECGEKTPKLYLYDVRVPVFFYSEKGEKINPIDVNRILRKFPIYQFRITQESLNHIYLEISPMPILQEMEKEILKNEILELFGKSFSLEVEEKKFDTKVNPYVVRVQV